ncbi:hypothetical protein H257_17974 [Aphanomyces astaci]|uniref:EXPERA domain-containing protein n=1 Tax=Aphanomyces astaci TaxID=112090 RepID=W4FED9_APHAT|nr:hypothetical protein H257_17974 [Aphanomyces astaci]ETV65254.1 hypothetical protein H257_17974 [Aphanomyces astaci]|eukprot:XP_009845255.1 hypothetical protein H257_17974 [Aphanomyces astaci]
MGSIMESAANFVEYVSKSTFRIRVLATAQVAVFVFLQVLLATNVYGPALDHNLATTAILPIPDARYGYDAQDLFELYAWMGPAVRQQYVYFELVDLFVFIPTYVHFLTLLLLLVHRRLGPHEPLIIYLPFLAAIFDTFENAAHIYTAQTFEPNKSMQKETWILAAHVGSISNILKWGGIGAVSMLLCWNFGKVTMKPLETDLDAAKKAQ